MRFQMRPVLIHGEVGTEYAMIAEAIHNNSVRHAGPFVSINVREIDPEKQINVLFWRRTGENKDRHAPERRFSHGKSGYFAD